MSYEQVSFEPVSVKELFTEMKDTSELLVDLAYSALLYNDQDIADEVLELEKEMDRLQYQARINLLLAARRKTDAEQIAPLLGIMGAAEDISNAAGDIAKVVGEDLGIPKEFRTELPEAYEKIVQMSVGADAADRSLAELGANEGHTRVLVLRRGDDWHRSPAESATVREDDILIVRGKEQELKDLNAEVSDSELVWSEPEPSSIPDLKRAVEILLRMKDMSEVAVDLAYGSVLYDNRKVAEEVTRLESMLDDLQSELEGWALKAAAKVEDPVYLRGLIHVARSAEAIADAASEISESVLRDIDVHPVFQEALEESEDTLLILRVTEDGSMADREIQHIPQLYETGVEVVAIRRPSADHWIFSPGGDVTLKAGDTIIAKGSPDNVEEFREDL